jgi:hypothetical protein
MISREIPFTDIYTRSHHFYAAVMVLTVIEPCHFNVFQATMSECKLQLREVGLSL